MKSLTIVARVCESSPEYAGTEELKTLRKNVSILFWKSMHG